MREQQKQNGAKAQDSSRGERGFGLLQLIITIAIAGIISVFAIMKITSARDNLRLSGSARLFASWVEKARLDAIRRHSTSSVQFLNTTSYRVTMDFDGQGSTSSRDISFESGTSLLSVAPPTLTFDWRGRVSNCTQTFAMQNTTGDQTSVDVTGSGDVTVDSDIEDLPTLTYTNVNQTSDILTDSTVSGSTTVTSSVTDCSAGASTGSITGTGTNPGGTPCSFTASVASITIKKNGGSLGSVNLTQSSGAAGTVTVTAPSNLKVTPATPTSAIAANGSLSFSVQSTNSTRGTFQVVFGSPCTQVTISVKVTK